VRASMMGWIRLAATLAPSPGMPGPAAPAAMRASPTPARLEQVVPTELVVIVPSRPVLHRAISGLEAPARMRPGEVLRIVLLVRDATTAPGLGEPPLDDSN
jgi:hypothetical protein